MILTLFNYAIKYEMHWSFFQKLETENIEKVKQIYSYNKEVI